MRMRMRMRLSLSFSLSLTIITKIFFSGQNIRVSYYLFNRLEILEKAKKRYSTEKAAEYYLQNKEVIKEKEEIVIRTCQRKKKPKSKSIKKKRYQVLIQYKKKH